MLGNAGAFQWVTGFSNIAVGRGGHVSFQRVAVDGVSGRTYVVAFYEGGIHPYPYAGAPAWSATSMGGYDTAVMAFDSAGGELNHLFARSSDGDWSEIAVASDGALWVASHMGSDGRYTRRSDGGTAFPSAPNLGYHDVYLARLANAGGPTMYLAESAQIGTPGEDYLMRMALADPTLPVLIGTYRAPGLTAEGDTIDFLGPQYDGYLWRHQGAAH